MSLSSPASRPRLLVVSPNRSHLGVLGRRLGAEGYGIAVAPDGEAAWGFTTPAMYRGMASAAGRSVRIYAGDDDR